jgi:hypothetical protein
VGYAPLVDRVSVVEHARIGIDRNFSPVPPAGPLELPSSPGRFYFVSFGGFGSFPFRTVSESRMTPLTILDCQLTATELSEDVACSVDRARLRICPGTHSISAWRLYLPAALGMGSNHSSGRLTGLTAVLVAAFTAARTTAIACHAFASRPSSDVRTHLRHTFGTPP